MLILNRPWLIVYLYGPVGQVVKMPPSQGGVTSSILVQGYQYVFYLNIFKLLLKTVMNNFHGSFFVIFLHKKKEFKPLTSYINK